MNSTHPVSSNVIRSNHNNTEIHPGRPLAALNDLGGCETLRSIEPFREAGFAIHWLHPREKRPIGDGWSEAPVATLEQLRATYRSGNNVGVRLGAPSRIGDYFLHAFDIDIRDPDQADEAWDALAEMFPEIDVRLLPCVASGSGGESRHLYFLTTQPFRSKKLATSEGKHRHFDKKKGRDVWSYDWEIELFGTDKQVAMPPSIHPDTGKPYTWLREFDFDGLMLGDVPLVPADEIEAKVGVEHETFDFEAREPLSFTPRQLERTLGDIPDAKIDDYHDWITLGQALHHQFGASDAGFDLWVEHSKRSDKFDANEVRSMRKKWRGFGRNRKRPVTMATIVEWARDARVADLRDSFDAADDEDDFSGPAPADEPAKAPKPAPSTDDFDDLLGGDDSQPVADEPEEIIDDIDLLGGGNEDAESFAKLVEGSNDWISLFDLTSEGTIKSTLHNVELIIRNDPRLGGLVQLNEFTLEPVQRVAPGSKPAGRRSPAKATRQLRGPVWEVKDSVNGDLWSDDRDFAIRSILEAPKTQGGYSIKVTDRDLKAAIVLAARDNGFHPVREYFDALEWDGSRRVERLFVDYLGAPDDAYTTNVARLMMVGAVARIFEPGHKADHVVILEGLQGKRKSTFIKILARHWFAELDGDFHDPKQMVELMQGAFILELPELSGFGKADVRSIKAFVSRQKDKVRLAYARRAGEYPRQCIFIGSTNDREYLKDDTGGRRWWPIECSAPYIDTERLEREVDQLWAETVSIYRTMRNMQPFGTLPLYLEDEAASAEARRLQESRRSESADEILAGQLTEWLNRPIVSGSIDDDAAPEMRNETCIAEIWCEFFNKERGSLSQQQSLMIGRALNFVEGWEFANKYSSPQSRYGKQRIWERGGREGRLSRLN